MHTIRNYFKTFLNTMNADITTEPSAPPMNWTEEPVEHVKPEDIFEPRPDTTPTPRNLLSEDGVVCPYPERSSSLVSLRDFLKRAEKMEETDKRAKLWINTDVEKHHDLTEPTAPTTINFPGMFEVTSDDKSIRRRTL